jgi:hypothetical protein
MTTEYETREAQLFSKQIEDVENQPLHDKQEYAKEWAYSITIETETVMERIEWLLNGSYGYGAMKAALSVANNKRMNRAAWMGITIAAVEWRCPNRLAVKAWKSMDPAWRKSFNERIERTVDEYLRNMEV